MKRIFKNNKLRTLFYIILVAVFLAGAIGITKVAANSALPGDTLYVLKTSLEQTQYNLSQDAGDRAQLKIEFAEKRLGEINELVSEGRFTEIEDTVFSFESAINGALIELETVAKSDPTRASALNIEISNALSKYAQVLTTLATTVPGAIQLELNRALESTLLADSIDLYDDDDMSSEDDLYDDDMSGDDDMNDDDMDSNDDDSYDDMDSSDDDSYDDDMDSSDDDMNDDDMDSNDDDSYNDDSNDDDMTIGDDDDMSGSDDDSNDDDHNSNNNDDDHDDDSSDDDSSNDDSHDDDSNDDDHSDDDDSYDDHDD